MSLTSIIAAMAVASSPTPDSVSATLAQPAPAASAAQDPGRPVQLEDIQVTGRRLDDLVNNFVNQIAAPNAYRTLAKWDEPLCVGVSNLQREPSEYLADRISTVAEDLGVRIAAPGCSPNLLIIVSANASNDVREMVQKRRSYFVPGAAGTTRTLSAFRDFVETDRPIRWWQVSMPTDIDTGQPIARMPGDCRSTCAEVLDMAVGVNIRGASRLQAQIVDRIVRTIVVVDVDQVSHLGLNQVADYIAMVSLAQIDPTADTSAYSSILNVFDTPEDTDRLTTWDQAYLSGLYSAEQNKQSQMVNRAEISRSIRQAHSRLVRSDTTEADD